MKEHAKASAWAEKRKLSGAELGKLTGYSRQAIYWFLRGEAPPSNGKGPSKISPEVWQRFKICCAGVETQLKTGKEFKW